MSTSIVQQRLSMFNSKAVMTYAQIPFGNPVVCHINAMCIGRRPYYALKATLRTKRRILRRTVLYPVSAIPSRRTQPPLELRYPDSSKSEATRSLRSFQGQGFLTATMIEDEVRMEHDQVRVH